ncbi:LAMI_0A07338g1_1 [Lachancea mirantina]|uniref:LAMI_0A07338g1_1 n=1 Tax=Lachancea mirantina TaxID=1230905 RepID=A0A1G4IQP0_9SACH|nr:LAMI_0A07338g1_1 [Lachancea mirantina]
MSLYTNIFQVIVSWKLVDSSTMIIVNRSEYQEGKILREHSMYPKVSPSVRDDGPKLREEKHYREFYPDLDQQALIPLLTDTAAIISVPEDNEAPMKQLIINDRITTEPISLPEAKVRYKKCKVSISELGNGRKTPKQYIKYGFGRLVNEEKFVENRTPYFKKSDGFQGEKGNPFGNFSRNQSNFQVEYDMDEQDELYLRHLNNSRIAHTGKSLMTQELFEIVMTLLENEWFSLEKKIPLHTTHNTAVSTNESRVAWDNFDAYGSDDGTGYLIDQPCAVCGRTECDNSNAIVFCDGCDVAVHQECYGVVFIPEGQWLCRRCMISRNRKINCLFCPSHTGAFKQTDTGSWGHVLCGIWIPELFFVNAHYMEPIEGIDQIPKSRWKLVCYICRQRIGACIQCSNKNCFTAYHVTCARRVGLCMDFGGCTMLEAASNMLPPGVKLQSFCDKHSPLGWDDCRERIHKARQYFERLNGSETPGHNSNKNQAQGTSDTRWKTTRGTPIAPRYFSSIVQNVLKMFEVTNAEKLAIDFCKYWSMKRELKRGAPLIRKFDPNSFNTFNTKELEERVKFAEVLATDLAKLQSLASLLVKRQASAQKRNSADALCKRIALSPSHYLVQKFVGQNIIRSKSFGHLTRDAKTSDKLKGLIAKIDGDKGMSMEILKQSVTEVIDSIENDASVSRITKLESKKLADEFSAHIARIEGIDVEKRLPEDFLIENGEIDLIPWVGKELLKEEQLSDVEELSIGDNRKLNNFMRR